MAAAQTRRARRDAEKKKTGVPLAALGAVAFIAVGGGGLLLANRGGDDPAQVPGNCESTQRVSLVTEQAMADVLTRKPVDARSCIQLEVTVEPSTRTTGRAATGDLSQPLWIPDSIRRVPATPDGGTLVVYAQSLASSPAAMMEQEATRMPACNTPLLDYPLLASREAVENNDAVRTAAHEITDWLRTAEGRDALRSAHLGVARPGDC